jgi:hypothetical protein
VSNSLFLALPDVRDAMRTSGGALPALGSALVAATMVVDPRARTRPTTHRTEVSR